MKTRLSRHAVAICRRRGATSRLVGALVLTAAGSAGLAACGSDPDTHRQGSPGSSSSPGFPAHSPGTMPAPPATGRSAAAEPDVECFGRAVTLAGTMGADRLVGTSHRDVIAARGGDDVVVGVEKNDRVCAGGGDDRVLVTSRQSYALVDLGRGDDAFSGRADLVRGGAGADRMRVEQAMDVVPGPGRDVVLARPAQDLYDAPCLSYDGSPRRIVADLTRGRVRAQGVDRVRGVQCLTGSRFADRIIGSPGDDLLNACAPERGPADRVRNVIQAGPGNDVVTLCDGGDLVFLDDGNDTAMGGPGGDWVYGGSGRDHVWGVGGSDHLVGGDGDDQVNGTYYCDLGSSAGSGLGDSSPNQVWGGDGNDEVTGDLGADLLDGGPGFDHGYGGPPGRAGNDAIVSVERLTSCS